MFVTKDIKLSHMIPLFCPKYRVCFLYHSCYFTRWELRENSTVSFYLMPMLVCPSVKFKLFGYRRCMMRVAYKEQLICQHVLQILCTSYPEFEQNFQNPGEKVIASCIAGNYLKKEHLYTKRMCQITAEKWLSCDHTFKVSANIGFWLNKRWVKLYDTLFIVLNEEGIALSWKLCKGTNFPSVENVLKLLKERLDRQGKNPTIFMLDNCRSWRTKVKKVFPNIAVKLDPFHAIQGVIKKIPKKKGCTETITQLRRQMILPLKNIFREPADKGEQRTMDTPSPEIILKNIDNFMRQWKTVEFNCIPLLPSSAVHEIEKLKGHVTKGCLSGIPPSGGTNRNETLH